MKKHLCILLFILAGISLHAQGTSLTLEVVPGELASQLTKEQMNTVKELTLTGEMYNCDFYVIRDSMVVLEILDLSNAFVDSIPRFAFSSSPVKHIKMSSGLRFLGSASFSSNVGCITWSNFPEIIEEQAFIGCHNLYQYDVSENNPNYITIDGVLFSKDKKKLIAFPPGKKKEERNYVIPDGVEEISNAAFMDAYLKIIELPQSVNYIADYAFRVYAVVATGGDYGKALSELICNSIQPPILGKEPFHYQNNTVLTIPQNSKELYAKEPGWNKFQIDGVSLSNKESCRISYWRYDNILYIQNENCLSENRNYRCQWKYT